MIAVLHAALSSLTELGMRLVSARLSGGHPLTGDAGRPKLSRRRKEPQDWVESDLPTHITGARASMHRRTPTSGHKPPRGAVAHWEGGGEDCKGG